MNNLKVETVKSMFMQRERTHETLLSILMVKVIHKNNNTYIIIIFIYKACSLLMSKSASQ